MTCSIWEELEKRKLPKLLSLNGKEITTLDEWNIRRTEIKTILMDNLMGYPPDFKVDSEAALISEDLNSFGGKAVTSQLEMRLKSPFSYGTFPFTLTIPKNTEKPPLFVVLSFTAEIADGLGEEILDSGFAIVNIRYEDIAPDYADDFKNGLGRFARRNAFTGWGKISIWSFAVSRVMDYICSLDSINKSRMAIIGHSRLGKTSLWCGATDERFSLVASIQSGAGGAALFRQKTGEQIANLAGKVSRCWFCGNLFEYCGKEDSLPFDQHFLLALVAPRNLYVASACEDTWADPRSELLSCAAASEVYEKFFQSGLIYSDSECMQDGKIGYHNRKGTHYFSRYDWQKVIEYRNKHDV